MKSIIDKYIYNINALSNDLIEKKDILNNNFLLNEEGKMKIYYAPHNEYLNKKAKIVIVGICPGWTQTKIAYEQVKKDLNSTIDKNNILKNCKHSARFAGSMRKNLIEMLNELELHKVLKLNSCEELFLDSELLHTTSLIPYPVFINGKNYTGHTPSLIESNVLMNYVIEHFYEELKQLDNYYLIIPLGKAVEEVLEKMVYDKIIKEEQCLFGFPHPSGANGHRREFFELNKEKLRNKIIANEKHLK